MWSGVRGEVKLVEGVEVEVDGDAGNKVSGRVLFLLSVSPSLSLYLPLSQFFFFFLNFLHLKYEIEEWRHLTCLLH